MLIVPLGLRIGADGASFVFENMWGTLIESLRISGGGSSDLMNVTIGMGNLAMGSSSLPPLSWWRPGG